MNPLNTSTHPATAAPYPMVARPEVERDHAGAVIPGQDQRVLRNTYALLSMTLLFSAAVAAAGVAFKLPAPGLVITLVGYFGLLFAVHKLQNSGWAERATAAEALWRQASRRRCAGSRAAS